MKIMAKVVNIKTEGTDLKTSKKRVKGKVIGMTPDRKLKVNTAHGETTVDQKVDDKGEMNIKFLEDTN